MENKKEIIVFMGMKNCGKDYNSKPYIKNGFKKIALADPLRDMLYNILGFTPNEELDYNKFKKSTLVTKKTNLFGKEVQICTGRSLMQNLGSVMKQNFGDKYWAKKWKESVIKSKSNVVCTDCRFVCEIKEAQSLEKYGYNVHFVWVCYEKANFKEILKDTHESEHLAQFLYYNQKKYGLYDLCKINSNTMNTILKDFKKYNKTLN